jgi:dihydrofolate reductase
MSETSTGTGKVVINRAMTLDGLIANNPGEGFDWGGGPRLARRMAPGDLAKVAAATGAMLVGRRTWDVGDEMEAAEPGSVDYPSPDRRSCSPTGRWTRPIRTSRS